MRSIPIDDTIVAISTAAGQGGIGIIRLSGKGSLKIADQIFISKNKMKPSDFKSYTVHYGWIINKIKNQKSKIKNKGNLSADTDADTIDEVLLTVMRAPKSYTREDIVEISCHGSSVSLKAILSVIVSCGARLAEPGEFTKRAFLNGRIDLAQAEAVLDIIQAKTDAFLKVSLHQLKGELTVELEAIREILMDIYTEIEAIVNFPEDDIDASNVKGISKKIDAACRRVEELLKTSEHGKVLKDGIKVVLCGKPNVGKSSLLNVFLKQSRAIVTDIAGTTRDTIEETAQIKGIPLQLIDTAGILVPRDLIEEEAVKRSRMSIESADLVLLILDGNRTLDEEDVKLFTQVKDRNVFLVVNKCDLPQKLEKEEMASKMNHKKIFFVSALEKKGISELENEIVKNVWHEEAVNTRGILISNVRHIHSLQECVAGLKKARKSLTERISLEFISEEIRSAVNCLDQITGRDIDSDLLDKIFSSFCIGK
ncbi:MAG: tRNA uridine-5-carboxymethylaminomethyl(34) synthesis GTPase MnmE [Candidatus Omnitrophota bacterium]